MVQVIQCFKTLSSNPQYPHPTKKKTNKQERFCYGSNMKCLLQVHVLNAWFPIGGAILGGGEILRPSWRK
jgi:hypothetical protein